MNFLSDDNGYPAWAREIEAAYVPLVRAFRVRQLQHWSEALGVDPGALPALRFEAAFDTLLANLRGLRGPSAAATCVGGDVKEPAGQSAGASRGFRDASPPARRAAYPLVAMLVRSALYFVKASKVRVEAHHHALRREAEKSLQTTAMVERLLVGDLLQGSGDDAAHLLGVQYAFFAAIRDEYARLSPTWFRAELPS
jgi:hypothetical protein